MPSIQQPSRAVTTPLETQRLSRVDGCPSCASNYETPLATYPAAPRGFVAVYRCTDCGHVWRTCWEDE